MPYEHYIALRLMIGISIFTSAVASSIHPLNKNTMQNVIHHKDIFNIYKALC